MQDQQFHNWQAQQGRMSQLTSYYAWTAANMRPHFRPGRVLDAGCGSGTLLAVVADEFSELVGVDFAEDNVREALQRFAGWPNVAISQVDLARDDVARLGAGSFDTVLTTDVMEHIQDDRQFVRRMASLLVPGGRLIIKVPALPVLYGSIDEASGHFRRYNRPMMRERLESAGLAVRHVGYMNLPGALLYFVRCRLQKRRSEFSATVSGGISRYNSIMPLLAAAERVVPPPFGLSLIAAAEKIQP